MFVTCLKFNVCNLKKTCLLKSKVLRVTTGDSLQKLVTLHYGLA